MIRAIIGVVVTAIVLYAWGFVYWGMGPYAQQIWKSAEDEAVARKLLREQFPENGTYYVPGHDQDPETVKEQFEEGPVAFVYVLAADGRPQFDPSIMIQGFINNLVVIILIAGMLAMVSSALPNYFLRVLFAALGGLTCAVLVDIGDIVWWGISWDWKLYKAFYTFSAWLISGIVLAAFIGPAKK